MGNGTTATATATTTILHVCGHEYVHGSRLPDHEIAAAEQRICPACNRERKARKFAAKIAWEQSPEGQRELEAIRQREYRWEMERIRREAEAEQRAFGWSAKRNATAFIRRVEARGLGYKRHDALTGSIYVTVEGTIEFRFSDHQQPAFGGWLDPDKGRSGGSDFSSDPWTGLTWRDAVKYLDDRRDELTEE